MRVAVAVVALAGGAFAVAYWRSDNACAAGPTPAPVHPMFAIRYCDYGGPDVLSLAPVETPTPGTGDVLVRVHAAAVNPLEVHFMRGTPYIMRIQSGLRRPSDLRLGVDFAGRVAAIGAGVTHVKVGDDVFGAADGALAEYVVTRERSVVAKPATTTFEQAAAVPVAAVTALQAVRDKGRVQAGQRVLVNGASGGVGTFAVQIAKALGAEVTGVSSGRNSDLVRSIGAAHAIDYTTTDYTAGAARYDLIVDMVGNHSLLENRQVLTANGTYVMVGGPEGRWVAPMDRAVRMMLLSPFVRQRMGMFIAALNRADLETLRDMMAAGTVTPVIDRHFPLADVPAALQYLETGRARGKVVITVAGQ